MLQHRIPRHIQRLRIRRVRPRRPAEDVAGYLVEEEDEGERAFAVVVVLPVIEAAGLGSVVVGAEVEADDGVVDGGRAVPEGFGVKII